MFIRLRHYFLAKLVSSLFAVPDPGQILELPVDKNGRLVEGKVLVGNRVVTTEQLEKYGQEARLIMGTDLFKLVVNSHKESAYKAIYEKSCDEKTLVGPKMWLWCIDVMEKTIATFAAF